MPYALILRRCQAPETKKAFGKSCRLGISGSPKIWAMGDENPEKMKVEITPTI
jgi:hypothetical protein